MFDRKRYKFPAETRKFGGRIYKYLIAGTKTEVRGDAERWQKRGFSTRIVPWRGSFALYTRRK